MDVQQSDVIKEEVFVKEESPFDWDFATGNSWWAPYPENNLFILSKKFLAITGATDRI